jgi:chromosome segregation ATPase
MALLSRVVCPHCHRLTLRGKFCINCGKELPAELAAEPLAATQATPQPPTEAAPQPAQQPPTTPQPPTPEPITAEEVAEERKLVEQLSKLHSWSLKLVDLFLDGEVPLNVFTELYEEYRSRINTLDQKRLEMVNRTSERIRELTQRSESLKIRHEVNEISDRDYIRQKIEIDKELSRLRPKLSILENPLEIRLADIPSFTEGLSKRINTLKEKGESAGLSPQQVNNIIADMQSLLDACQGLVQQHSKIQHEIKKLETRYKIGELKQDEYLAQRQRLERQLELTF